MFSFIINQQIIFLALLVFAVGLNAQQDIEDDGNLQIEIATEDATNANPIAQQVDPIEEDDNFQTELENEDSTSNAIPTAQQDDQTASVDGNLQSQLVDLKSIIAKLTTEREEKDATISEQELVKQKQMALIIGLQEKEDKESTGIANLQGQLANQTGINANLQSQLANQANVIANIKSQLANQTAINANLTADCDKKKLDASIDLTLPKPRLLYDVRRSAMPYPVRVDWHLLTYNTSITNVGNWMNISTGQFTAPVDGKYYFAWQGPNGEDVKQDLNTHPAYSYLAVNTNKLTQNSSKLFNDFGIQHQRAQYDANIAKTDVIISLKKGDLFGLLTLLRLNHHPEIQYQKGICFFLGHPGCVGNDDIVLARAAADALKK